MQVSLIITTYNWPAALGLTLQSIARQSRQPLEVIIADDGSGPETEIVIQHSRSGLKCQWRHVRHADDGIRQARIKNLAVKYASGDYLIFLDHDVPVHPEFVADHLAMARPGCFLQGKRVFLPEAYSQRLLTGGWPGAPSPFLAGIENRKNAFRLPRLGRFLGRRKTFQTSLRGCNLSMFRRDFTDVDGYDETFDQLWGREDSDICYRLFNSGRMIRNLWFSGLQYHLHHDSIKNREPDRLDAELRQVLHEKRKRALIGFSRLSDEGRIVNSSD